jgi:hypothetical protein
VLHTQGAPDLWGTVSSPPFLIDFDELRFLFGATHPWLTRARLLVNGQEVLSEGGNGNPLELREVRWPLSPWNGRIGVLQLVDIDTEGGFVIVEDVRSKRYRHLTKVDDSEFDRGFWSDGSPVPTPLEEVARKAGLAMMVGRHAMTTRHLQGTVEIASKPFRVRRAQISFLVFDFGGADTRIELHLDGEPRRAFVGSASRALRAVTWQVRDLRGEEATLVMRDGDLDLDRWIGIDEVASFDR